MTILKIGGVKEILDILKGLFAGVSSDAGIPAKKMEEMGKALTATAELIDETLVVLRRRLTDLISELKYGDEHSHDARLEKMSDMPRYHPANVTTGVMRKTLYEPPEQTFKSFLTPGFATGE